MGDLPKKALPNWDPKVVIMNPAPIANSDPVYELHRQHKRDVNTAIDSVIPSLRYFEAINNNAINRAELRQFRFSGQLPGISYTDYWKYIDEAVRRYVRTGNIKEPKMKPSYAGPRRFLDWKSRHINKHL